MLSLSELGSRSGLIRKMLLILVLFMIITPFLLHMNTDKWCGLTSSKEIAIVQKKTSPYYRIQLDSDGSCIGSSDGFNITFLFCDPKQQQTFQFLPDGKLEFSSTGLCVSRSKNDTESGALTFTDCSTGTSIRLTNGSYLQTVENIHGLNYCINPKSSKNRLMIHLAILSECDGFSSKVNLIEETEFLARRKPLLLPMPENTSNCNFPACSVNRILPPVELLPSTKIERCSNLSECVTVVVKTSRRPHLVLRLVQSIRDFTGYDLPIIAYDDGLDSYSEEIMSKIASFSNLQYVIGDDEDLGIALGRTLAVKLVQTKYFLLCDDDLVFNNHSNIEVLAEILDTTDASVAGGRFDDIEYYAGYLNFSSLDKKGRSTSLRRLKYYHGACFNVNETIVNFPNCMKCDTTANFFMAKKADLLEAGGWSEELKIQEHEDLFLRLKAADKKVVWCPRVSIYNERENKRQMAKSGFLKKRGTRIRRMRKVFENIWNFHVYEVHKPDGSIKRF